MRLALRLHPDGACTAVTRIDVDVARPQPRSLALRYEVTGRTGGVRLPPLASPERTDGLWRHTCLEAFVRVPTGDAYLEFNLSPSTRWAAYRFTGYRAGGADLSGIAAPRIGVQPTSGGFVLLATLDLAPLSDLPAHAAWRVGLSAVIEETDGGLSYWALAHPPGRADFHHADCFAGEVPAPGRS